MKEISLKVASFFALGALVACATVNPTTTVLKTAVIARCQPTGSALDKIVGGQSVEFGDPDETLVTMLTIRRGEKESVCTGALLSDHVVLTAAHCVSGADPENVTARFVTKDDCPIGHKREYFAPVENVVIHRDFDGTPQSQSDLAILEIYEPAPKDQQRLKLVDPENPPTGAEALLIGFGITDEKQADSKVLRRIRKNLASDFQKRERSVLVDQSGGKGGFCRGDSGAPILVEVYGESRILAVNSATVGLEANKECQTLSLAMRTDYFRDWILERQKKFDSRTWLGRRFSIPSSVVE